MNKKSKRPKDISTLMQAFFSKALKFVSSVLLFSNQNLTQFLNSSHPNNPTLTSSSMVLASTLFSHNAILSKYLYPNSFNRDQPIVPDPFTSYSAPFSFQGQPREPARLHPSTRDNQENADGLWCEPVPESVIHHLWSLQRGFQLQALGIKDRIERGGGLAPWALFLSE